jgi:hypothetical protein
MGYSIFPTKIKKSKFIIRNIGGCFTFGLTRYTITLPPFSRPTARNVKCRSPFRPTTWSLRRQTDFSALLSQKFRTTQRPCNWKSPVNIAIRLSAGRPRNQDSSVGKDTDISLLHSSQTDFHSLLYNWYRGSPPGSNEIRAWSCPLTPT